MEQDLDFFYNNNACQLKKRKYETEKIKRYTATRIKSQNFLTNVSHNEVKEEDLFNSSFAFNICALTTKNINPFYLERNIFEVKDREMINMFWEGCNKPSFCKHICQPKNVLYLKGKKIYLSSSCWNCHELYRSWQLKLWQIKKKILLRTKKYSNLLIRVSNFKYIALLKKEM